MSASINLAGIKNPLNRKDLGIVGVNGLIYLRTISQTSFFSLTKTYQM